VRAFSAFLASIIVAGAAQAAPAIGDKLVPFTLKNYKGEDVDLKAFQGKKALVLMFIATQCPVSNAYNDRMVDIAKAYSDKGVAFVGINANRQESVAEVAEHAQKHGFPFNVLKDVGNVQADHFGAQVTPETFVYDNTWSLRYHGRIDDNQKGDNIQATDLKNALDAVVGGTEVPVKETKAFGCTIKRVPK